MLLSVFQLVVSLIALTAGAEFFIRGSVGLAMRFGLSAFFIGLTIVGFGTSSPEMATSVAAAFNGNEAIAVGNVVGSNIFNVAMILGITALLCPIAIRASIIWRELPIMVVAVATPYLALLTGGVLGRGWGLLLFSGLIAFLFWGYRSSRAEDQTGLPLVTEVLPEETGTTEEAKHLSWGWITFLAVFGLALLIGGSHYLVLSASNIARSLGISEMVIALTIVAAGTSAPELFTSAVSAWRKQPDIAVGNIIGSNIFNSLGILGAAAIVRPQSIGPQTLWLDLPVMLLLCLACIPVMLSGHRISRGEGVIFLGAFASYIIVLLFAVPQWFPQA
jgi:cation:H+ antiporter